MQRKWLAVAAASGLISVALGAFGAHGLKHILTPAQLDTWHTAVLYQMFHTLALIGVALVGQPLNRRLLNLCGWLFSVGILLFSGSLYMLVFTATPALGMVTPIGGVLFILAWALLLVAAVKRNRI